MIKETEDEILHIILTKVYLITKGYRNAYIHFLPFSKSLCSSGEEERRLEKCIDSMVTQNFIASKALGTISITHDGIKQIERLLENSSQKGSISTHASQIKHSINESEKSQVLEIQKLRYDILKLAYSSSNQGRKTVNLFKIGEPLGIEREKLERIYFYLQDEGQIDFHALGGDFFITDKGKELILKKNLNRIF